MKVQPYDCELAVLFSGRERAGNLSLLCNYDTMRRVAIPILDNLLSEHFGGCNFYEIFEIEDGEIRKSSVEVPKVETVDELPQWLVQRGITDVIVYKIKKQVISLFASKKINLFVGIPRDTPERLIEDYQNGMLESDEHIIHEITNELKTL